MIDALPGGGSRTILLSRRANIFYLDKVRVHVRQERVIYQVADGENLFDYNLPDCNTCLLLLGKGSSITDAAIRALAKSGVVVGFAGTGGTPPHSFVDHVFLNPADEYRPTEYCQTWVRKWMDETWKLEAARYFLWRRMMQTRVGWSRCPELPQGGSLFPEEASIRFRANIARAQSETELLLAEAMWTKAAYKALARATKAIDFSRNPGKGDDLTNRLLDHGNYLMYGLATVALHALGIPAAFPVLHGKTRRGALVFDVADLYKDGLVLPLAFTASGKNELKVDKEFRGLLVRAAQEQEVLDGMIEIIKETLEMDVVDFKEKMRL